MLQFLVTSTARRRLLQLLWGEGRKGSATVLAELADVGFASAYRELKQMLRYQLVVAERLDGHDVYSRNEAHPDAAALRALVASRPQVSPPRDGHAEDVRAQLRALGAPLGGESAAQVDAVERALVDGVKLARRDPVLARVLPLAFWAQRDQLDQERLLDEARRAGERQAVGFMLALTGSLGRDRKLGRWAAAFRDHRVTARKDFFELPPSRGSDKLAAERAPAVARAWGFTMNLDMASFQTAFEKFVHA